MAGIHVLLVEDDAKLARLTSEYLEHQGLTVTRVADGPSAIREGARSEIDVVVLDLMLPGCDGFDVCRELRKTSHVPIIATTARVEVADRVLGLELGADDYMTKPFALQELEARLLVLARRGKGPQSRVLQVADLSFNLDTLTVSRAGKQIPLNPIGLKLLQFLMEASPSVVTRQDLEHRVWGEELPDSDSLRVHIHGLRAALDKPFDKPLIQTRHGIGYRMADPDAANS